MFQFDRADRSILFLPIRYSQLDLLVVGLTHFVAQSIGNNVTSRNAPLKRTYVKYKKISMKINKQVVV